MIAAIIRKELGLLMRSPLAWVLIALSQLIFAWLFLLALEDYLLLAPKLALQDHAPGVTAFMAFRYLAPASTLLLIICPLLTMRAFADEFRLQTYPLLASSPLGLRKLVIGKFLAYWLFGALLGALMVAMPLAMVFVSGIDPLILVLSYIGIVLLVAAVTAIGLFFSSLTKHNLTAAISTLATVLMLWLIGKGNYSHPLVIDATSALSISPHLASFFQGIVSRDRKSVV